MTLQVVHITVAPGGKPRIKPSGGVRYIDVGDADVCKPELLTPLTNPLCKCGQISLTSLRIHDGGAYGCHG